MFEWHFPKGKHYHIIAHKMYHKNEAVKLIYFMMKY